MEEGSADLALRLYGSGFVPGASVEVDGAAVSTTHVSSGELGASVPASALAQAGTRAVVVVNPAPGGGRSAARTLTVEGPACARSALHFDGVDDYAEVASVPATSAFTIEAWLRGSPSGPARLFGTNCGTLSWGSSGIWGSVYPDCNGTTRRYLNESAPFSFSAPAGWYHLAMVVSAPNALAVYVNGQLLGSSSSLAYDGGVNGTEAGAIGTSREAGGAVGGFSRIDVAGWRVSSGARYSAAFTPPAVLTADGSTQLLYAMIEGSGQALTDGSGNGRHGTIVGATWATDGPCAGGQACYALDFDGVDDVVRVPASPAFSYPGEFTAEAWILPRSGYAYQHILAHNRPTGSCYTAWLLDLEQNQSVRFQFNDQVSLTVQATVGLGAWHHVAGVYSGGVMELFVDGVSKGTKAAVPTGVTTDKTLDFGRCGPDATAYPWAGQIGPTRVSRVARYSAAFTPRWGWTADASTIGVWNFASGAGAVLVDESGGGHSGTIEGATWQPINCPASP